MRAWLKTYNQTVYWHTDKDFIFDISEYFQFGQVSDRTDRDMDS